MKKLYLLAFSVLLTTTVAFSAQTAFDSMDKAVEVKLSPQIKTTSTANNSATTAKAPSASSSGNVQIQKYNNALVNLDDAQVELRQELANVTEKYNAALAEKEKATQNCKILKKEINAINKKMKNVDKSKKMINANLETDK